MARPIRRPRFTQVPDRERRRVAHADGSRLRRHLLFAPCRPVTPIEETMGALDTLVRQGRPCTSASRPTVRSGRPKRPPSPVARHAAHHPPAVVLDPQPVDRGRPDRCAAPGGDGRDRLHAARTGSVDRKYLGDGSAERAQKRGSLPERSPVGEGRVEARGLDVIAKERGQTLAQLALQWVLRDGVVSSALIGASRTEQLDENIAALSGPAFDTEELERSTPCRTRSTSTCGRSRLTCEAPPAPCCPMRRACTCARRAR